MAPTSAVPHLLRSVISQGTARVSSHKTALLRVPLIFASLIFCPVGRDHLMTLRFFITPAELIFTSQVGGIILQMLDSHHQMCCLYLIEVCGTIWLNGIVPRKRKLFIFSFSIFTDVFPPSPCNPKELFNLHHACYTPALSLCHALIFFSVLPLCVPPVRFSVPYRTTLAVAA